MRKREEWTPKGLYKFLNCRYFRSRLPDIPVVWNKRLVKARRGRILGSTLMHGETGRPLRIELNPKYKADFKIWAGTLLHEMVHVQYWKTPYDQAHGRKFIKRMKQLASIGAYNPLW